MAHRVSFSSVGIPSFGVPVLGGLHSRYPWFWLCRLLLAVTGGVLTVAYGIDNNPLLAIDIGVATPLIIQAFGRSVTGQLPPSTEPPNAGTGPQ